MSINVVCPGCKKRFAVSEKFAGQKGPCPNCKTVIAIPAVDDEVVVHDPISDAPTDATGKKLTAPILREESKFSTKITAAIVAGVVTLFVLAAVVGRTNEGDVPLALQALAAIVLAPVLVAAGYSFLRDDDLEPFRGRELYVRVMACGLVYAFLWGAYAWVQSVLEIDFTAYQLIFVAPAVFVIGAFASLASLDLDFMSGLIHYGMYLIVTVLLRCAAGMPAF